METDASLLFYQEPSIAPYSEQGGSTPHLHIPFI